MKIEGYTKCECGAITVYTNEGTYSCKQKNLRKFFPGIDLRKLERYTTSYNCDHCVNHYGLDLCGCGSGEDFGKCENGMDECEQPMQVVGGYTCVRGANAWGGRAYA